MSSDTFLFQALLCQGQQLRGKDEEDGECSLCALLSESWPGGRLGDPSRSTALDRRGWVGARARPPMCTFSSNQSPKAALLLLGQFILVLNVSFLNKPSYKNRQSSLRMPSRLLPPTPGSVREHICPPHGCDPGTDTVLCLFSFI